MNHPSPVRTMRTDASTPTRLLLTLLVLGVASTIGGIGTWAAFSGTTENSGNGFTAGTVVIGDDDGGQVMLSLTAAEPAHFDEGCVQVTYSGSLSSRVRLYGVTGGSGLASYLDLKITRGTRPAAGFDTCTGFTADSTEYLGFGRGAGVMYEGTLQAFPDDYTGGLLDPYTSSPETWTNGEVHVYKIRVTLQDVEAAQGLTASQTFTWEARNT